MNKENEELYNDMNDALAKCDDCRDCDFYYVDDNCQIKLIAKALIGLGYHKAEVKTNGDYIRYLKSISSDEVMAEDMVKLLRSFGRDDYKALFVNDIFDTHEEAYNANLEWLKKEYKGGINYGIYSEKNKR